MKGLFEKKYNDALGWMRKVYPTLTGADKEDAEHFFPELKESEDERIRQCIGLSLTDVDEQRFKDFGTTLKECLAYLERQKEQKPEDDKAFEEWIDDWWKHNKVNNPDSYDKGDEIQFDERGFKNFCRGIRNMYAEQKPAEWSGDDEKMFSLVRLAIWNDEKLTPGEKRKVLRWLRVNSPKSNTNSPHWKPSEEQMETLEYYMHVLVCNEHKEILFGLYKQLKSLYEIH